MKNKSKKLSRKFGFNKDREGLITRYLNEPENWKYHIDNTKKYIISSAKNKNKECCIILGSGWWLDIPIDELHERFNELIFIDISHPNQIKKKAEKYPKVKLITADISGVLGVIQEKQLYKTGNLPAEIDNAFNFDLIKKNKPDFVVSLNILSQIAFFPIKYLQNKKNIFGTEADKLGEYIEKKHLEILPKDKSCIITDYYQYEYDFKDNLLSEQKRLKTELLHNATLKEWIWDFDMSGNCISGRKVKFKVAALQV